ncbi:M90 family metallopeptidase [Aquimarina rhabdastrellae]
MQLQLIIIGIVCITILLFLVLKKKQEKTVIAPIPEAWRKILEQKVVFYRRLLSLDQRRFEDEVMRFLSEIVIEGVKTEITDEDKVLIAASAVIPIFGFESWKYTNLKTVLIYPDYFDQNLNFENPEGIAAIAGLVGTGRFENQMILSKKALHHGFDNNSDKLNTAIHEFVHLLDKSDGAIDGIPKALLENHQYIPWLQLMHHKMEAINKDKSDIRNYGGTSETEFLAVASEYFFSRPKLLKRKHPELYKMMVACFKQDLAKRKSFTK